MKSILFLRGIWIRATIFLKKLRIIWQMRNTNTDCSIYYENSFLFSMLNTFNGFQINWIIVQCVHVLTRNLVIQITGIHTLSFSFRIHTYTHHKTHNSTKQWNQINNFNFQLFGRKPTDEKLHKKMKNKNSNTASCWPKKKP